MIDDSELGLPPATKKCTIELILPNQVKYVLRNKNTNDQYFTNTPEALSEIAEFLFGTEYAYMRLDIMGGSIMLAGDLLRQGHLLCNAQN
jgi:hypothetical protein